MHALDSASVPKDMLRAGKEENASAKLVDAADPVPIIQIPIVFVICSTSIPQH